MTFLFILALEILFHLMKLKPEIKKGLAIFDHCYFYFNHIAVWLMLFSPYFSGFKPNLAKPEIVGIGVLKEVQVAVCSMLYRYK